MEEVTYQITQIEEQKHRKDRLNIYLDGAFAFGLDSEVVIRHHLHEGDELTERLIDDILLAEEKTRAKEKALSYLNYRARSIEELKRKLEEKQFSNRVIQRVIGDLIRVGLLDDKRFAATYVHSRMIQKPMGKRLLRQELLSKGIDEEMADEAVDEAYGSRSEAEVARGLIRKRLRGLSPEKKDPEKQRKRLSDFLFRRGFNWEVINEAFQDEVWEKEN